MNPKFDINAKDEDDDFEATHRDLERYVRGGEQINSGLSRLVWERKVMRRVTKLERLVDELTEHHKDTGAIARIAQAELAPTKQAVDSAISWRNQIIGYVLSAAATGLVAWFLYLHGVKS